MGKARNNTDNTGTDNIGTADDPNVYVRVLPSDQGVRPLVVKGKSGRHVMPAIFEVVHGLTSYRVAVGRRGRSGATPYGWLDRGTPLATKVVSSTTASELSPGARAAVRHGIRRAKARVHNFDMEDLRQILHHTPEAEVLTFKGGKLVERPMTAVQVEQRPSLRNLAKGCVNGLYVETRLFEQKAGGKVRSTWYIAGEDHVFDFLRPQPVAERLVDKIERPDPAPVDLSTSVDVNRMPLEALEERLGFGATKVVAERPFASVEQAAAAARLPVSAFEGLTCGAIDAYGEAELAELIASQEIDIQHTLDEMAAFDRQYTARLPEGATAEETEEVVRQQLQEVEMQQLRDHGWSAPEIAERFGVSPSTVYRKTMAPAAGVAD